LFAGDGSGDGLGLTLKVWLILLDLISMPIKVLHRPLRARNKESKEVTEVVPQSPVGIEPVLGVRQVVTIFLGVINLGCEVAPGSIVSVRK
jgi:hypothetical protein